MLFEENDIMPQLSVSFRMEEAQLAKGGKHHAPPYTLLTSSWKIKKMTDK